MALVLGDGQQAHAAVGSRASPHLSRAGGLRVLVLSAVVVGCATADASRVQIASSGRQTPAVGFDRVLVAGFVAGLVSDRREEIDVNQETARFLRMALRSKASLHVVESEPLWLEPASTRGLQRSEGDATTASNASVTAPQVTDPAFADVAFWKRIGEEYGEPLILTGTVIFKAVPARHEERTAGPRTIRSLRQGFSLAGTWVLIDGRTGEVLGSATLRPGTAHAINGRESALSIYFQLMERAMPSLLTLLGLDTAQERVLLR